MTKQDEQKIYRHFGDGEETRFYFGFTLFDDDEANIRCLVEETSGEDRTSILLILSTDYSVEFTAGIPSGFINLTNPIDATQQLVIQSNAPYPQDTADPDIYTKGLSEGGDDRLSVKTMEHRDRIADIYDEIHNEGATAENDPILVRPIASDTYLESNFDVGDPDNANWVEQPIVVLAPVTQGHVLHSNSDGSTTFAPDLTHDGTEFIKQTDSLKFTTGGAIKALGLDLSTGTYDKLFHSYDENNLPDNPIVALEKVGNNLKMVAKTDQAESSGIVPPTRLGTYMESSDSSGILQWKEETQVVSSPFASSDGEVLIAKNDGTTEFIDEFFYDRSSFRMVNHRGTLTYSRNGLTKKFGVDLGTGTYDTLKHYIDELNLPAKPVLGIEVNGNEVKLIPVAGGGTVPDPTVVARYIVSVDNGGNLEWEEQQLVAPTPLVTDAGFTLVANGDGATGSWQGDLTHDGTEFIKQTAGFKYHDTDVLTNPDDRTIDSRFDFNAGTYTKTTYELEEGNVTTNSFLRVTVDENDSAHLIFKIGEAGTATGTVTAVAPITKDYLTKFTSSSAIITSSSAFLTPWDHNNTGSSVEALSASRFAASSGIVHYKSGSDSVLVQATANGTYTINIDIGEGITKTANLELVPTSENNYSMRAVEPDPSELFHTGAAGGTVDNSPTFLESQEIENPKFVEDSLLTDGPSHFKDLTLLQPTLGGLSHIDASTQIESGVLTLDLNDGLYFQVNFSEEITSLVINKKNATDRTKVYLIFVFDGAPYDITWSNSYLFQKGIEWSVTGEVQGVIVELEFTALDDTRWLVTPITAPLEHALASTLVCIDASTGGNVVTLSGSGYTVFATGEPRIEDSAMKNIFAEEITIGAIYYPVTSSSVVSGVIAIDTLDEHDVFEVTATENITSIEVGSVFDKAHSQHFSILLDETIDDLTVSFGSEFLVSQGLNPTDTVAGRTRHFVFFWSPGLQAWITTRQQ